MQELLLGVTFTALFAALVLMVFGALVWTLVGVLALWTGPMLWNDGKASVLQQVLFLALPWFVAAQAVIMIPRLLRRWKAPKN